MPDTLAGLILRLSAGDQVWLCLLAIAVALLDMAPLELQRRMVDRAVKDGSFHTILVLGGLYAGLVILQGLCKYVSNIYRAWVSENAVRTLRSYLNASQSQPSDETEQGVKVSMVLAESEPIGAFVGDSVSEPVLHVGILVSVVGYLIYLQPLIAVVLAGVFLPQIVFVPLFQTAINKRAQQRVATLREASAGVIEEGSNALAQEERFARVFRLNLSVNKLKYALNFLMNLAHNFGTVAILVVGGFLVLAGKSQAGTVVAFISGLATVKDPWGDIVNWYQNLMVTNAKFQLMVSTLSQAPAPKVEA